MAKKKTTKKSTKSAPKRTSKASTTKKKVAGKSASKVTKKKTTKKKVAKKAPAKKVTKKVTKKKTTKKPTTKKVTKKKVVKKKVVAKKAPAKVEVQDLIHQPPKKVKTTLSTKELNYFRQLLLEKRAELIGDLNTMGEEALKQDSANLSHYADHMADVGSDNFEQELTLGLMESERKLLQEIDAALDRIAEKTYGMCEMTGEPITKARLEAKPWAQYSIEAAREMERNGKGQF